MLMTSAASAVEPSPLRSIAKSMPWIRATPEHAVESCEQTVTASSLASGATPFLPAMMSATCVPCEPSQVSLMAPGPHGIGSGSGRERRAAGPADPECADEVVPADDLGRREQLHAVVGIVDLLVLRVLELLAEGVLVREGRARAAKRGMGVVDACVEDRDEDAGAGRAGQMDRRAADVGDGLVEIELVVDGPGGSTRPPRRATASRGPSRRPGP